MNFDERMEVLRHITGYDIEPSMVRIAEMNMFLHGATDPDIHEYDTLTDESKWEEKFNVILANPPFMTPKGGIKPHKRFGVSSNRAEVLFVDYISNHLRLDGKAGIIVPEGVVFQTGKAYQELRKNLVDNSLIAVISMPGGIFQPYAGVKTSILILDKKISKERKEILFVELNNDGFTLTTQRTPQSGSEIKDIIEAVKDYKLNNNIDYKNAFTVSKEKISENDYCLSLNKYKEYSTEKKELEDPSTIIQRIKNRNKEFEEIMDKMGDL
jgi:type I restriction enzyme M protein